MIKDIILVLTFFGVMYLVIDNALPSNDLGVYQSASNFVAIHTND